MNFTVEAPGEATPLGLQELARILAAASSNDHNQRQSATQQLSAWESHPGYFSSLQLAFLEKSLPSQVRHLAIIQLKNGIDRYWRSTARNAIPPEEKQLIRSRLFQGTVDEDNDPFALQNALTVAKVIRIDYPKDWPDALTSLISTARTAAGPAQLYGALQLLLRVVKELSTARLRKHQEALRAVTPEIVNLLGNLYSENVTCWVEFLTKGRGDEDNADYALKTSLTALKLLRRLMVDGYEIPHRDPAVQEVWQMSQAHFGQFLEHVGQDSPIPAPFQNDVGKHLLQFTKLHISMADTHPGSFANLPNSLPLVQSYWTLIANFAEVFERSEGIRQSTTGDAKGSKSKMEGPLLEKLALKGMLLLRSCVNIVYGQKPRSFKATPEVYEENQRSVDAIKDQLFTNDFVVEVVKVIITKLFIFRQSDLEAWEADPEEWEAEEAQGLAWEWAVRPCAEVLLLDFLIHYENLLMQPLLDYFATATQVNSDAELDIVRKEAVYAIIGLAAAHIHENFDFNTLLTSTLVNDLQLQVPYASLLRRRIAILISQWIPMGVVAANRAVIYDIYRFLLNPDDKLNGEVVNLTAARYFKPVIIDFEFPVDAFVPFAADIFKSLITLVKGVSLDDTKQAILDTVRSIIERMEEAVSPYGDAIMTVLPELWDADKSDSYVVKQPILAIIAALVTSMKTASQKYQHFMVPLLSQALNPESPLYLNLVEEAVELWKAMLEQSPPPLSPELVSMAPLSFGPLEFDTAVAHECILVVKAYLILAPEAMLGDNLRRPVLDGLSKTLTVRNTSHAKDGAFCIETLIRAAQKLGGDEGISTVITDMTTLGILGTFLREIYEDWEASKIVGPNAPKRTLMPLVEENYFAILARLALASPTLFLQWLTSQGGDNPQQVWDCILTKWFAHFDAISDADRKKLSCLALTRLCEGPDFSLSQLVLPKLQDYLVMWSSVINELQSGTEWTDPNTPPDYLVWTDAGLSEWNTVLGNAEAQLAFDDPVHTVHTYQFVETTFQNMVARVGGQQAFTENWLVNVDKEVLEEFERRNKQVPNLV